MQDLINTKVRTEFGAGRVVYVFSDGTVAVKLSTGGGVILHPGQFHVIEDKPHAKAVR